jgi:hypothetical protein
MVVELCSPGSPPGHPGVARDKLKDMHVKYNIEYNLFMLLLLISHNDSTSSSAK